MGNALFLREPQDVEDEVDKVSQVFGRGGMGNKVVVIIE